MTVLYIVVRTARISLGALLGSFGKVILHFSLYPLVNRASIAFFFFPAMVKAGILCSQNNRHFYQISNLNKPRHVQLEKIEL